MSNFDLDTLLLALAAFFTFIAAMGVVFSPRPKFARREDVEELLNSLRDELHSESDKIRGDVADVRGEMGDVRASIETSLALARNESTELIRQVGERVCEMQEDARRKIDERIETATGSIAAAQNSQANLLAQTRQTADEGFARMNSSVENVSASVSQVMDRINSAVGDVQNSLEDLAKRHNETKAQTSIQLCEALISSLGTLRNQIAASVAAPTETRILSQAEAVAPGDAGGSRESEASQSHIGPLQTDEESDSVPSGK